MIKRTISNDIKKHLTAKEITLIVGPRQAGKTTLMLMLKEDLHKKGEKTAFLNLDIEADKQFFNSQARLMKKIELEIGKGKGYVFIDEIQRKEDAGVFLKGIYDMNPPYKFVVSGSGSLELKEKIHESLVGRKRVFELNTLSFDEFVNFKTGYRYADRLQDFFQIERDRTKGLLEEYLSFGGYPRVVLEDEFKEKNEVIREIYQSYLEKDICYLLGVKKAESFDNLLRVTASQVGGLVNFSELSATLGISIQTVKNYLWYLEKTFILQRVTPYFKNIRKEITKSPTFYFYDLGLRNYSLGIFGNVRRPQDLGFLFQNLVLNILKDKTHSLPGMINFWRTKDRAEVDFVITVGELLMPVEVKYRSLKEPEVTRSLRSFISKYEPSMAFVVNLELEKTIICDKTEVNFIPFYRLDHYIKGPSQIRGAYRVNKFYTRTGQG